MNKYLKLGLGVLAVAGAAHVAYHGYKNLEDELAAELIEAIRAHFSYLQIATVWLFDEPDEGSIFKAGVVVSADGNAHRAISLSIDAKTLEITEISEEIV